MSLQCLHCWFQGSKDEAHLIVVSKVYFCLIDLLWNKFGNAPICWENKVALGNLSEEGRKHPRFRTCFLKVWQNRFFLLGFNTVNLYEKYSCWPQKNKETWVRFLKMQYIYSQLYIANSLYARSMKAITVSLENIEYRTFEAFIFWTPYGNNRQPARLSFFPTRSSETASARSQWERKAWILAILLK